MCPMDREYFLYTPDKIDETKTYWLLVGVHFYKGQGRTALGLHNWVENGECIVVGPTFPSNGYQVLLHGSDRQLIGVFDELKKEYRLHSRMFLFGFSGGAQFVHRFTLKHPELVAGCSAHSGGSWSLGKEFGTAAADQVPFVFSCGQGDVGLAGEGVPYGRLEYCHKFEDRLSDQGFYYKAGYWEDQGHGFSAGVWNLTHELWRFVSTGLHDYERKTLDQAFEEVDALIKSRKRKEAAAILDGIEARYGPESKQIVDDGQNPDGWRINHSVAKAAHGRAWPSISERLTEARRLARGLPPRRPGK